MLGASSVSFNRTPAISCSMSGRTSPFPNFLVTSGRALYFLRTSLQVVASTILSMTYGINIPPYNDPYINIAEEATGATAELMILVLVDIIPILKYVPEWFPDAKFQSKAAVNLAMQQ